MLPLLVFGGACLVLSRLGRDNPSRTDESLEPYGGGDQLQPADEAVAVDQAPAPPAPLANDHRQAMVDEVEPSSDDAPGEQLAVATDQELAINDHERQLNRHIWAAAVSLTSAIASIFYPPLLLVTLGAAIYATRLIFRNGYNALFHERKLRMDVAGSLYFIGAYAGGFFIVGSAGLIAYYMGEKLVLITQDRSQQSLINIFGQKPRTAWQIVDGTEVEVPVESVHAGDTVVIQAGQVVPVDGVIISGIATIDQHMLTGEGQPAEKGEGDQVLTATLIMGGRVHVRVEKTGQETVASQIGVMLNNTASYQASIVTKGEQLADKSVPPTMALAVIAIPLSGYRYSVTILGSAIGLNIRLTAPIAMLNFLNVAANQGILIKDGRSLELLQDVDTVVFDKTGTLTLEQPHIAHIHTCAAMDAETVLFYAAAAEHRQTHPIALAILSEAEERGVVVPEIDPARYEMGYGLSVRLDDHVIRVGSNRYMDLEGVEIPPTIEDLHQAGQEQGHSLVMVAVDDELVGAIELAPILRPEVKSVVHQLRERGLDICIISGDQERPTRELAESLDIPHYFANTLPADKARLVEELQSEGRIVCFIGDGINDSVALKKANVSVSMRGASTAASDTAQIVLMGQGIQQLPFVFELSREFDSNMKSGFYVAVGQGVIVITGALLGIIGIGTGTLIWGAGLLTGVAIAQRPLRMHPITSDGNTAGAAGLRRQLKLGSGPGDSDENLVPTKRS